MSEAGEVRDVIVFLSAEQFWDKMCDPRFCRVSLNQGAIGMTHYLTNDPPEEIDGFLEEKICKSIDLLEQPKSLWRRLFWK